MIDRTPLRPMRKLFQRGISQLRDRRPTPGMLQGDLYETESAYLLHFDAPGVSPEDVQVRFVEGDLFVRVERFREPREDFRLVAEGRKLSFDGRVTLPETATVEPNAAEATVESDGTVKVRLPKAATTPS